MDLIAKDLNNAVTANGLVGKRCCVQNLKGLTLPNHLDWMYVTFKCSCKEEWKIWRNEIEITKPS